MGDGVWEGLWEMWSVGDGEMIVFLGSCSGWCGAEYCTCVYVMIDRLARLIRALMTNNTFDYERKGKLGMGITRGPSLSRSRSSSSADLNSP
jgi:hypothetical protein